MLRAIAFILFTTSVFAQHYEILNMGIASRDRASNVFSRYSELTTIFNRALSNESIHTDVKLRIMERESEITAEFEQGNLSLAVVSPVTYLIMRSRGVEIEIIGAEIRYEDVVDEAVIVTPKSVSIKRLDQIEGRSFGFGPVNDPLFDWCARAELSRVGLKSSDLTTKNYTDFDRLSELIQMGRYQAGILPKSYVDQPDHPFRVLAECRAPYRLWVMKSDLIPFTRRGLRTSLLELQDPRLLNRLGIQGIKEIDQSKMDDFEAAIRLAMAYTR